MFNDLPSQAASARRVPLPRRLAILIAPLVAAVAMVMLFGALAYAAPNAVTWPEINLTTYESGFAAPVNLISAHDGTDRLFVLERKGVIRVIENGSQLPTPFLDISSRISPLTGCGECGLLGLAFPPDFADEGYFFVNYTNITDVVAGDTGDQNGTRDTIIARFTLSGDPNVADPASHTPILQINQPDTNHNGGHILFGPDGYLYIGMGDGGGGGDTFDNAQDPASLHGKILRLAVGPTITYTIPPDNPFIDTAGYRDEIWAMGVRNPWRFSFDRATGDLYLADVGQGEIEEVNHIAAAEIGNGGMNFGWPILEGNLCYPPNGAQDCERTGFVAPVFTYDHSLGDCSVTGGYVYPSSPPIYLFADYCSGRLWGLQQDGEAWATTLLDDYNFQITSFGKDEQDNVYIVGYGGAVYQIDDTIGGLTAQNNGPTEVNYPIQFTAIVTAGAGISFTWDFGDGNAGVGATPSHVYTQTGLYTATVVASNDINTLTATTVVDIQAAPIAIAGLTASNNGPKQVGEEVSFSANITSGTSVSYTWTFGDGGTGSGMNATHAYTQTGVYTAMVVAANSTNSMTATTLVTVTAPPPLAGLTATNDGPKQIGEAVGFTTNITSGTATTYTWDFGDGSAGSGITTTHSYTQAGVYTATVVAANSTNSMTATTTVYVGNAVVDVTNNEFTPQQVTIPAGGTVVWVLREGTHSVTADDGSFDQPAGSDWPPFVHTFANAAAMADTTISYHCTVHPEMTGTVTISSVEQQDELLFPFIRLRDKE